MADISSALRDDKAGLRAIFPAAPLGLHWGGGGGSFILFRMWRVESCLDLEKALKILMCELTEESSAIGSGKTCLSNGGKDSKGTKNILAASLLDSKMGRRLEKAF